MKEEHHKPQSKMHSLYTRYNNTYETVTNQTTQSQIAQDNKMIFGFSSGIIGIMFTYISLTQLSYFGPYTILSLLGLIGGVFLIRYSKNVIDETFEE